MKSTEVGSPRVKNETFEVIVPFVVTQLLSGVEPTSATVTQFMELMGFLQKSIVHLEFSLIAIGVETRPDTSGLITLYLVPADSNETTLSFEAARARAIDIEMNSVLIWSTVGAIVLPSPKWQTWIDETFYNDQQSWAGLYLYMRTTADTNGVLQVFARAQGTMFILQRNYADNYTRKGMRITEGWEGYEWEESFSEDEM